MLRRRRKFTKQALPSQEEVLLDYVKRLCHHKSGRRAVHLYLSRLSRESQHPQDIDVAASQFKSLVARYDGQLFRLANLDIVFVAKGVTLTELDDVVIKLRYMFRDDPNLRDLEQTSEGDPFCIHYDIAQDYDAFLDDVVTIAREAADAADGTDSSVLPFAKSNDPAPEPDTRPAPRLLRFARHDPVFAWSRNNAPAAILSEVPFDLLGMRQEAGARKGTSGDLWLLRTLTSELDADIAARLLAGEAAVPTALVLPVTPESVLAPEFDKFNSHYRSVARTPIVFEFSWLTVMQNAHMFLGARDRVLQAGHKICIAGWDPYAFAFTRPERLDAHFLKVAWRETLKFEFRSEWSSALSESVRASGVTKVVLTDCTSSPAADFGQRHGFLLFQGKQAAEEAAKAAS